jgi:hypothetical protein
LGHYHWHQTLHQGVPNSNFRHMWPSPLHVAINLFISLTLQLCYLFIYLFMSHKD